MIKDALMVINILPSSDYREFESAATDIFASQSGKEQRYKKASRFKRSLSYTAFAADELSAQSMEELITYAQKYNCLHPLWFSLANITNIGLSATIERDATNSDFKIGDYALIRKDFFNVYAEKITAVTNDSITLQNPVNLEDGMVVLPLIKCMLSSAAYSFSAKNFCEWKLEFKELL